MDELAYLNAGLTIELIDKRSINARLNKVKIIDIDGEDNEKIVSSDTISTSTLIPDNPTTELAPRIEVYKHDGGIKELIQVLCDDKTNIHPEVGVITIKEERKGVAIEVAMQWSKEQYTDALTGFADNRHYCIQWITYERKKKKKNRSAQR